MDVFFGIIGVFVGWCLNEIGNELRRGREHRSMLGRALSVLISLRNEMTTVHLTIEAAKELGLPLTQFETLRQRYSGRYLDDSPGIEEARVQTIKDLSGPMPLEADELRWILRTYLFSPKVSFKSFAALDQSLYIKSLSAFETALLVSRERLDVIVYRVARMHGYKTWFRLHMKDRKAKKAQRSQKVTKEIVQDIRTMFEQEDSKSR
jgi:hypothetical protein